MQFKSTYLLFKSFSLVILVGFAKEEKGATHSLN